MVTSPPQAQERRITLPGYVVTIAPGSLANVGDLVRAAAPAHRYAVITDEHVGPHYAAIVARSLGPAAEIFTTAAGEAHKTRASWAALTDAMLASGHGRDSTIVALGGGVVGDLAGFVAATYMRGIPVVQVPTTLLAMVDASVGGKVGVDTAAGKNLVGAFHRPAAVAIDPLVLRTLPMAERRAGLAEVLKHGIIADECYFEEVVGSLGALLRDEVDAGQFATVLARSVEIKAGVVTADEREGGIRKVLNFGHTIGHAVEQLSGYAMLHGEAVSVGMLAEAALGERLGVTEPGTTARIAGALAAAGLPVCAPPGMRARDIVAATAGDKKARAGMAEYALPRRIGAMEEAGGRWSVGAGDADVVAALADVRPQAVNA